MPKLPGEFEEWRSRFHRLLQEAVSATPLRFNYTTDPRTLFMTHPSDGFDIRAVLPTTQNKGIIYIHSRTELVVPTMKPHAMAMRVQSILAAAGSSDFPISAPDDEQHVQHTGAFTLTWEEMRANEHQSIGWYLYHVIRLHDLFSGNLRTPAVG